MPAADPNAVYTVAPGHRLQWEEAQQCWVVLYPEGMVRLNDSAAEILRRCDGATPLSAVIADLEQTFGAPDLADDVLELVTAASAEGWLSRVATAGG
ncbi:pyrroloquinoline quinone biosynthesis peptide chaperone PqqD [Thiohalocapsa sp. ML1]|jgi:pyrroloquinoline quinone biosynthesis protein D|uniref:pyrroloquinoline quinone biosynthesis peptide chaperone PqqD n=1 Tax=Thiohalocapsa sp. ML1 TaxID=1431688 RepID=UPI0007321E01|nr:pyrroloquinoline quinone biosynthesis peptide chaperone PqqD [Thiohalocapsa sp. ML1]